MSSSVVFLIGGPTASGKSELAVTLAQRWNGVVINADSMQVYRDLSILTARPSADQESRAPHRLYGVLDGAERCSAARWRDLVLVEIRAVLAAGKVPFVVGGTGLYFKALTDGLAPVPTVPDDVRDAGTARHAALGPAAFHAEVCRLDPVLGARLNVGDPQRLIRAWSVATATGRPLSTWHQEQTDGAPPDLDFRWLVLAPPREALYAACNARLEMMIAMGALDELAALQTRGLSPDLPLMKAVAVPELSAFLRGETDLATASALAQQATRHYAKRQSTWFRHQVADRWTSANDGQLLSYTTAAGLLTAGQGGGGTVDALKHGAK